MGLRLRRARARSRSRYASSASGGWDIAEALAVLRDRPEPGIGQVHPRDGLAGGDGAFAEAAARGGGLGGVNVVGRADFRAGELDGRGVEEVSHDEEGLRLIGRVAGGVAGGVKGGDAGERRLAKGEGLDAAHVGGEDLSGEGAVAAGLRLPIVALGGGEVEGGLGEDGGAVGVDQAADVVAVQVGEEDVADRVGPDAGKYYSAYITQTNRRILSAMLDSGLPVFVRE